jgi:vancomycin permeability regulator SanA
MTEGIQDSVFRIQYSGFSIQDSVFRIHDKKDETIRELNVP